MGFINFTKDGAVGIITIDRQEALNALNADVLDELDACIGEIEKDKSVKSLVITGAGRAFVAGADVAYQQPLDVAGAREFGRKGSKLFRRIEKLEIPVIAAVNGFALGGGCELALSCDMILASDKAKFGQPEVGLGITPGFSGTQRLPRRVGCAMAKELLFSGAMINAAEAERIGLANHVYPLDELMTKAVELAKSFAANASIAVKYTKACVDRGIDMDIDNGIGVENEFYAMCFATEDQKEGMSAFLEKREKNFKDK